MQYITYFILLSFFLQGCASDSKDSDFPSAGVITYNIDYPEEISGLSMASLMPNTLKLSFKNNMRRYHFNGGFNIFSLEFISLSPTDSCVTIFRFMDSNLLHASPVESNFFLFDKKNDPVIALIDSETKEIANMTCYKATVSYPNGEPFSVYYSKDVDLQMPNRHTPYTKIPGVLMEFYVDYNNVRFHFTANHIDYTIPEDTVFNIPRIAKATPESEIEDLILTLIETLQ